ncbi:beta-N-acetylhexosaminidase [Neptunicella sp.]|uniref:beta-N-acetylhexosaminidase n=1 Tax=Neptunicella sp. TaxID=2125986 RepID=UPI003F690611
MIIKRIYTLLTAIAALHTAGTAAAVTPDIIPQPQQITLTDGTWSMQADTVICASAQSQSSAKQLNTFISAVFGQALAVKQNCTANGIVFSIDNAMKPEAYDLVINQQGIEIRASTDAGWFYGVQSLMQIIQNAEVANDAFPYTFETMTISDEPRFAWRAFMLDEGRHFFGEHQVKKLLDEMARLKMNVFHWHLADDQGWRIEIKKYPRLTEIGSMRKSTQVGAEKWDSPKQSGEPHGGFYTQQQIRELVKYATDRHITVVPEIEMPGHSSAAIASYNWLGTSKKNMEVPTKFGVSKDVYDVSDEKVIGFLTDVLDEVIALFPSKVIHIGGDEVKYDQWKSSPQVQQFMQQHNLQTPAELQVYFTNMISQYLQSKGRRMMGWNEILGHQLHEYQSEADTESSQSLAKSSVVHFWKGDLALATKAAKDGFDIVNSIHSETYLDYDYKTISLAKAYNFDPVPDGLADGLQHKIIGSGCQMWTEWTPTRGELEYMIFPRIAAYAEVDWTDPAEKNFEDFKRRLVKLKAIWTANDILFADIQD